MREWCMKNHWALLWTGTDGTGLDRIIDPVVAASTTLNISKTIQEQTEVVFARLWNTSLANSMWATALAEVPPAMVIRPLWADDCADSERCIGRSETAELLGDCVCYAS